MCVSISRLEHGTHKDSEIKTTVNVYGTKEGRDGGREGEPVIGKVPV